MRIFAIDPGAQAKPTPKNPRPDPACHGWCWIDMPPGERPVWIEAGHSTEEVVRQKMIHAGSTVVVERPVRAHREAAGMSLLDAAFEAGRFYGYALGNGFAAGVLSAEQWRNAVTGLRSPSDAQVKEALSRLVTLPKRSNAHERDACGLAVGFALRAGYLVGGRGRLTPRRAVAG